MAGLVKVWTSEEDWEACTLADADTETAPGSVLVDAGEAMAEVTTPVYERVGVTHQSRVVIGAHLPEGSNVVVRYRVGATESACGSAEWSDWFGAFVFVDLDTREATAVFDLLLDSLNRSISEADQAFVQYNARVYRA